MLICDHAKSFKHCDGCQHSTKHNEQFFGESGSCTTEGNCANEIPVNIREVNERIIMTLSKELCIVKCIEAPE